MRLKPRRSGIATVLLPSVVGLVLPPTWAWAKPAAAAEPPAAEPSPDAAPPTSEAPPEAAAPAGDASPPTEDSAPAPPAEERPPPLSKALTGAAKEHYDAAVLLFEDGDAAGALLKFREAYEASNDPRLLWNMAACQKQQRHYAKMLPLLEQYLAKGGALVSDAERIEAQTVIETLQPFVAVVQVEANERGAQVFVDGELVGRTPLAPLRVDMGTRQFVVKKPGFVEWTATEQIAGGTARSITATLKAVRHVGTLRIVTDSDGTIRVDGRLVGHGHWEGELPSGTHSITVRSPGKQPYEGDAAVLDGQSSTLRVALKPIVKPAAAGLPAWMWIAGGALLTAGVGLGAYALLSSDDRAYAPPLEGTMQPGAIEIP